MVTLYLIKYGIGCAAPTLHKETFPSSFFCYDGVKELSPGVWRIEHDLMVENGVGSDIWYQDLDTAKHNASEFYLRQIRHFRTLLTTLTIFAHETLSN